MSNETFSSEATYAALFTKRLEQVRKEAKARGYECDEPYDMTDEYLRWNVFVCPAGKTMEDEDGIDVELCAHTSEAYEGEKGGVNFSLGLCHYGGEIVGGYAPHNYTPACWVPIEDKEAIRDRWNLFDAHFSAAAIVDQIDKYYAENS